MQALKGVGDRKEGEKGGGLILAPVTQANPLVLFSFPVTSKILGRDLVKKFLYLVQSIIFLCLRLSILITIFYHGLTKFVTANLDNFCLKLEVKFSPFCFRSLFLPPLLLSYCLPNKDCAKMYFFLRWLSDMK